MEKILPKFFSSALSIGAIFLMSAVSSGCSSVGSSNEADEYSFIRLPGGGVGIEMVKIDAGVLQREKSAPVNISRSYWIGKYEVTQAQFEAVMGYNPAKKAVGGSRASFNMPVIDISWYRAKKFCRRLNTIYKGRLPEGYQFDLPTVAQWEYACCAGTSMAEQEKYYDGLFRVAGWTYFESPEEVQPVGLKRPNAWGIFDMHGNAQEWCLNFDEAVAEKYQDYPGSKDEYATICGWGIFTEHFQLGELSCFVLKKIYKHWDYGFRVALVPVEKADTADYDYTMERSDAVDITEDM